MNKKIIMAIIAANTALVLGVKANTETHSEKLTVKTTTEEVLVVPVSDDAITQSLDQTYDYHHELDDDVTFSVKDGVVTLTGLVDNTDERKHAEELAYEITGVNYVVNKLISEASNLKTSNVELDQTTRATYQKTTTNTINTTTK